MCDQPTFGPASLVHKRKDVGQKLQNVTVQCRFGFPNGICTN